MKTRTRSTTVNLRSTRQNTPLSRQCSINIERLSLTPRRHSNQPASVAICQKSPTKTSSQHQSSSSDTRTRGTRNQSSNHIGKSSRKVAENTSPSKNKHLDKSSPCPATVVHTASDKEVDDKKLKTCTSTNVVKTEGHCSTRSSASSSNIDANEGTSKLQKAPTTVETKGHVCNTSSVQLETTSGKITSDGDAEKLTSVKSEQSSPLLPLSRRDHPKRSRTSRLKEKLAKRQKKERMRNKIEMRQAALLKLEERRAKKRNRIADCVAKQARLKKLQFKKSVESTAALPAHIVGQNMFSFSTACAPDAGGFPFMCQSCNVVQYRSYWDLRRHEEYCSQTDSAYGSKNCHDCRCRFNNQKVLARHGCELHQTACEIPADVFRDLQSSYLINSCTFTTQCARDATSFPFLCASCRTVRLRSVQEWRLHEDWCGQRLDCVQGQSPQCTQCQRMFCNQEVLDNHLTHGDCFQEVKQETVSTEAFPQGTSNSNNLQDHNTTANKKQVMQKSVPERLQRSSRSLPSLKKVNNSHQEKETGQVAKTVTGEHQILERSISTSVESTSQKNLQKTEDTACKNDLVAVKNEPVSEDDVRRSPRVSRKSLTVFAEVLRRSPRVCCARLTRSQIAASKNKESKTNVSKAGHMNDRNTQSQEGKLSLRNSRKRSFGDNEKRTTESVVKDIKGTVKDSGKVVHNVSQTQESVNSSIEYSAKKPKLTVSASRASNDDSKESPNDPGKLVDAGNSQSGPSECPICSKILPSPAELSIHTMLDHKLAPYSRPPQQRQYKMQCSCKTCFGEFNSRLELARHKRSGVCQPMSITDFFNRCCSKAVASVANPATNGSKAEAQGSRENLNNTHIREEGTLNKGISSMPSTVKGDGGTAVSSACKPESHSTINGSSVPPRKARIQYEYIICSQCFEEFTSEQDLSDHWDDGRCDRTIQSWSKTADPNTATASTSSALELGELKIEPGENCLANSVSAMPPDVQKDVLGQPNTSCEKSSAELSSAIKNSTSSKRHCSNCHMKFNSEREQIKHYSSRSCPFPPLLGFIRQISPTTLPCLESPACIAPEDPVIKTENCVADDSSTVDVKETVVAIDVGPDSKDSDAVVTGKDSSESTNTAPEHFICGRCLEHFSSRGELEEHSSDSLPCMYVPLMDVIRRQRNVDLDKSQGEINWCNQDCVKSENVDTSFAECAEEKPLTLSRESISFKVELLEDHIRRRQTMVCQVGRPGAHSEFSRRRLTTGDTSLSDVLRRCPVKRVKNQ